ncbi:hypothetical protein KAR91_08195 [Candidatus Pacearchaeota archaeon]|nr:hypothetical protein [Candidatus Pacearchaeota archaeon]
MKGDKHDYCKDAGYFFVKIPECSYTHKVTISPYRYGYVAESAFCDKCMRWTRTRAPNSSEAKKLFLEKSKGIEFS